MKRPFSNLSSRQNSSKLIALLFWLALIGGYYLIIRLNNLTLEASTYQIAAWLTKGFWGPLVFILLYMVGPLLFFPAIILTLLGGFIFGPMGIIYTVIGSNSSAMIAFGIGRYFGNGMLPQSGKTGIIQRYTQRIRQNSFETVLIMHLIFLPFELVNYTCGFLQIDWKPFLAGTALGSIVATISIVMLGASFGSIEQLVAGEVGLNATMLLTSILLIVLSVALSRYIRKRENQSGSTI